MAAELKPIYLIHGDDHGAIAQRRARLRSLAEGAGDASSVEILEGEQGTPAGVALALCAMTMAMGRRVIVVDGVERWKPAEVQRDLLAAIAAMPPDTTLALFAREEGRSKVPPALHKAVAQAAGQVVEEATVKPWELPKWVRAQADALGLQLDMAAAKALVAQVGERQQRLLRELEKLSLEASGDGGMGGAAQGGAGGDGPGGGAQGGAGGDGPGGRAQGGAGGDGPGGGAQGGVRIGVQEIELRAARSAERRAFSLADALVGADAPGATRAYLSLRGQGERLPGLTYLMASRLREAIAVALRLQAGESVGEVRRGLRMPPRAAERFVGDVQRSEPARLRAALAALGDLEVDTRGGAPVGADRTRVSGLGEDTLALRAMTAMTAA